MFLKEVYLKEVVSIFFKAFVESGLEVYYTLLKPWWELSWELHQEMGTEWQREEMDGFF